MKAAHTHRRGSVVPTPRKQANRSTTNISTTETMKQRQIRTKEMKEACRALMDARHRFVMSLVAIVLDLDESIVEEAVLDTEKMELFDSFLRESGSRKLLFFYQEIESDKDLRRKRLFVTNGKEESLTGQCVVFTRVSVKLIKIATISEEICCHVIDLRERETLLSSLHRMMDSVIIPAVKSLKSWGPLSADSLRGESKDRFVKSLEAFSDFLKDTEASVSCTVKLSQCERMDVNSVQLNRLQSVGTDLDVVLCFEQLVSTWYREIEQVLTESEQMRKEADDVGPSAELDHWKRRMAKFNSLLEAIRSKECRIVVAVLLAAKSKLIKTWRELDQRITEVSSEAKDNVKFLYALEKFWSPLYKSDPVAMIDCIPNLIHTIRMIYSVSNYYNTSERMTSLFGKVTNQMVTACKSYITQDGLYRVWDLPRQPLIGRMLACLKLKQEYLRSFQKTKNMLQHSPNERPFDFSEMYIFGKFEAFCRRLSKIIEVLHTFEAFSSLTKSSIEGLDPVINKFGHIISSVKKKPYNVLDHRKTEFEADYDDFLRQVQELELQLQTFLESSLSKIHGVIPALEHLAKFQRLNIPSLEKCIFLKHMAILKHNYIPEIDQVAKTYEKWASNPPIAPLMPPIAGRIGWVRQLFHCLEQPMRLIEGQQPSVLDTPDGRRALRNYNRVAYALVKYEIVYHRGWLAQVEVARDEVEAALLSRHRKSGKLQVNLDPVVLQVLRETECLVEMGFDVPDGAKKLYLRGKSLKTTQKDLTMLLASYESMQSDVPAIFRSLMRSQIRKVDLALSAGMSLITWNSVNIDEFINHAWAAVRQVEYVTTQIKDMLECRIQTMLAEMSSTELCALPENNEPWTISDFVHSTMKKCSEAAIFLESKSQRVEEAVADIVSVFRSLQSHKSSTDVFGDANDASDAESVVSDCSGSTHESGLTDPHERLVGVDAVDADRRKNYQSIHSEFDQLCKAMTSYFSHAACDALLKATKDSLDALRRRVFFSRSYAAAQSAAVASVSSSGDDFRTGGNVSVIRLPFFKAEVSLAIPSVVMQPSLDDVQQSINRAVQYMLDASRRVYMWGQARPLTTERGTPEAIFSHKSKIAAQDSDGLVSRDSDCLKSFYKNVNDNKDVSKLVMVLSSSSQSIRQEINAALQEFSSFQIVWENNLDDVIQDFLSNDPVLSDFEGEIQRFQELMKCSEDIADRRVVASLELCFEPLKLALGVEIKTWIQKFGRCLNNRYKAKMDEVVNFVTDYGKRLSRPINDLEDVRNAMAALEEIRQDQIRLDMSLGPIEEAYAMLQRHHIGVRREESERIDSLRYSFEKLLAQAGKVQNFLVEIQPKFKADLLVAARHFGEDLTLYADAYQKGGPMVEDLAPQEASDRLAVFQTQFDELWRRYTTCSGGQELFGLPVTVYPSLHQMRKELSLLQKLYSLYDSVIYGVNGYYDLLWTEVNIEKINAELLDFQNRCRKLPRGLKEWQAYLDLKKKIDDFSETCPLLELMANKAMKDRHWQRISELTGHLFDVGADTFQLRNIMEAPLLQYKEDIEDICIAAVKEKDIEAKLDGVINEWHSQELSFSSFKSRGELLLKGTETSEIVTLMEDSLMILSSLMSNRYNAPLKKGIQAWVQKLSNTTDIIENWLVVQNLWVYLEAVFVGGDIAKQLPKEAKRFLNIDKSWMKIMTRAHEVPNVVQCCVGDEMLGQLLPHLLEQLELCQKSLSGYLEKKRLIFPRFFFVSDPALLEILGQASDSHTIQAHLLAIFDNIKSVVFHEKDYDRILAVSSRESETIQLEKTVSAQGNVEVWLGELLVESQASLHGVIRDASIAIEAADFSLLDFLNSLPAQVGLLGLQMIWTRDAELALAAARHERRIMQQTNAKFLVILNKLIDVTTQDLTSIERVRYETLITIHVHQRDIFDDLVRLNVKSPSDFEWLKQSRFYFNSDTDKCLISITDVTFVYQNEFLGCTDRLVITPLTDRCYITLAQALGMSMGGAPAGPAGTGKTETVKDMGKALGKYVVVFNCSDQMDYRGLGRIYKGLAQSGSWGCFDEFNRIELPVLSVAAQQIAIVLGCKKDRKNQFVFSDGDIVEMNAEFGIFLTMNPGYAGRQELPENLKIQFRTVAMMVPDRQIIMRVKLASCGFQENLVLAQKFFTLYKLCEEQLTKQVHYDFGLRNILSVLRTLGAAKRQSVEDSESTIVMRVLRDMNMSKLVDEDEPLFMSLINDLFPSIALEKASYPKLEAAIDKEIDDEGLVNHLPWKLKLIQLYETQRVRHGMMTLGPTGAGKTKCINVLMKALAETGLPHREMRMNPKAITASQMFGRLDVATNDWTDGIFSTLWRKTLKTKKGEHVWIVLDGPVDAIWIENLNSVLDDNKTLTLANGDRIPMSPFCKIIFEVHNIDNASPATVSRNGMVYMSSSVLNWRPILLGWLKKRPRAEADILWGLFDVSFDEMLSFVQLHLDAKMDVLECSYIYQAVNLLEGLIPGEDEHGHRQALPSGHLEKMFVFAIMWSLGALLELSDRLKLENFLREQGAVTLPPVDDDETIFEYFVDTTGNWQHWSSRVQDYLYPPDKTPEYASILVPNVDNVRTIFLVDLISKQRKAILLIGEQGTAKTVMIKSYASKYDCEKLVFKSFNFSSATTPLMVQRTIESYVDKRMGSTYGPPAGKRMTIFVDDINMPVVNEWGDQVTNEIVRQLMQVGGFYSLDKPGDFTHIVDIQLVAAMIHPGGGRNDIPSRLKRQFSIFNCALPSNASIDKIFGVIGCGHFCSERGFSDDIRRLVAELVPATRILWQATKMRMLPTPAKFHYIFNLRDLSRIWHGMLQANAQVISTTHDLLALWRHECTRVIADRFTCAEDRLWFESKNMCKVISDHLCTNLSSHLDDALIYFADFLRDPPEPTGNEPDEDDDVLHEPKIYEPIPSFDFLAEKLGQHVFQYNETIRGSQMDLVFFKDAMIHVLKISRIIRMPRGNALLVGVGGSGKQSLTKLASFIAGYKIFQITLSRMYNVGNLMDDLKFLYRVAGGEGRGITFLFTDNEIKDESFLEYVNNVLSSGEVSNLFARDELDEIAQALISPMKKEFPRRPPTDENLYEYFIGRARNNMHVVLCFSPIGEKFRNRALRFPGLISGCTMDWFSPWPKDALVAVSEHFLSSFSIDCTAECKRHVVKAMGKFQDVVAETCTEYFMRYRRQTFVTPKSYLSFINGYKEIYSEKQRLIGELADRMKTGLNKLVEASDSVAQLSVDLAAKEKELEVASAKADTVLVEVTASAQAAEKVKSEVQKVKDKAQSIVEEIEAEKLVAETKLAAAKPALEEAEAALQTIKSAHIATVRKLAKPPHLIMRIMDSVLLLFRRKMDPITIDPERSCVKPSWGESLKCMSQSTFLSNLQSFQKDTINGETVDLLAPYLEMEDYRLDVAKKVCGDVAGLLQWTRAMSFFFGVNKEVLPLKANLMVQEARLTVANKELASAQAQLDEKQKELDEVQAMYEFAMKEKQDLLDDAESCRRKMQAASALINGLGGEKERWTSQSKEFQSQIGRLVGDVLLATAFLSYAGPFNQEFRSHLLQTWGSELTRRKVPFTADLNITSMLVDTATIGEWNLQGLPNDELSLQNGIIVTKASRYPLLIDPQGQGKIWIKNREKENDLQLTYLNHKYFRSHLEGCLSLGRPLLIENVGEELDPVLDNILEKNFIKSGRTLKVKVGDKEVDVLKGFKIYITTKLANPAYSPEISARTAIIDFTVTMKGLEDQLLGRVILTEKQELEGERTKLMEDVTANKRKMKELEDNLLYRLTSTQGSLVDDESLIAVLATTKATAQEVSEKLHVAAETEAKINEAREEFRPVATRGSILYFLIVDMSMVNVMYQTSLRQFLGLFDQSMARAAKSPITSKRIHNIIEYLTYESFKYSVRGFYEHHKFLFTLMMALKIDIATGAVKHDEFQKFVKGGAALDLNAVDSKPFSWISDMTWLNLVELSKLPVFSAIVGQVSRNEKAWRVWLNSDAPEEETIPDGYQTFLNSFRTLLLIRSWCPDRTIPQARKYVADSLGKRYAEGVILDLDEAWEESDAKTPIIFFLSMGSDPTNEIELLAKKVKIDFRAISMGQGQEVHARRLLNQFIATGGWVLLQNCHLGLNFMDELLETMIEADAMHHKFRLWITTEVHCRFPIGLLQISIKLTNEPPQGVKAGLKRTYTGISHDLLEITNMPQWKPMLYAVAYLHTTVQERRKFGPLGWNIPYEFNQADQHASIQFIQNHLDDVDLKKGVSWSTVRYMIGEVQYGGRVTDDYDKRLLNTLSKVWFGEHMFHENFSFHKGYVIPRCKTVSQYLDAIDSLPLIDSPQAFGLHENANITYQSKLAADILDTIMNIQPKDGDNAGGETRESIAYAQANEMLKKLPPDYIPHEVKMRLEKMGILLSMNIFLRQEIDRMTRVLKVVRQTLTDLKLAIEGTIIMSETLRDILDSMFHAKVPELWRRVSWESSTLGFWFTELLERNAQFSSWLFTGRPTVFWMTGFFNPQGFLTAMRQEVTRAHKGWALDSVVLHNDILKQQKDDIVTPPTEGVYVHGLYLDGAGWDRRGSKLIESQPKVLFSLLPVVHIYAVNVATVKDSKFYHCPVYKKPRRTDLTYVTTITLRTQQNPDHWILRGVALLCDVK